MVARTDSLKIPMPENYSEPSRANSPHISKSTVPQAHQSRPFPSPFRNNLETGSLLLGDVERQAFTGNDDFGAFGVLGDPILRALADGVERVVGPVGIVMEQDQLLGLR